MKKHFQLQKLHFKAADATSFSKSLGPAEHSCLVVREYERRCLFAGCIGINSDRRRFKILPG